MSEEREKEVVEGQEELIKQLINELKQLRLAIQAHTKALYMLSSCTRSYNSYKRSRGWKRWKRRWVRR